MKKYHWPLLLLLISQYAFAQKSNLEIEISGIKKVQGKIQIAIYNDSTVFPEKGKAYRVAYFKVISKEMTVEINELPHNDYAVVLFHDLNNDEECNLNFIGIPKEPYGFSNNARPVLKAPSFDAAKIILDSNKKIRIALID